MSRIRILPPELADKIAAGEVVERPASVVKELVENSLDAGAAQIRVEVLGAGRRLLRVADDGCGMTAEEAQLSVRRHATSKIQNERDLFNITTLGFRGEALPSIAAVSQMTMETKPRGGGGLNTGGPVEGVRLELRGGEFLNISPAGVPDGTTVSVENLFYNTPARLKFLKSDGVEVGHIENTVLNLALGCEACAFELFVEERQKIFCPAVAEGLARVKSCLGEMFVEDCIEVEEKNPFLQLHGWVLHPRQTSGNTQGIYFYLNGRFLRDRVLQHALCEAYGDFLMKGRTPKAVLFLRMPPEEVDVNVHPSKREVRFRQSQAVHQFVERAVKKVLQREICGMGEEGKNAEPTRGMDSEGTSRSKAAPVGGGNSRPSEGESGCGALPTAETVPEETSPSVGSAFFPSFSLRKSFLQNFQTLRVIGTLAQTYILCESPDHTLVLIDQHAAHERIGYEKLKKNFSASGNATASAGEMPSQKLLLPLTWEATPKQAAVLQMHLENLKSLGLVLEPFGGNTFSVSSVPLLLREKQIPNVLEKLAEEFEEHSSTRALEETLNHVLKTIACHAQVRAGDPLSTEECRHLLTEMDEYHATHCPHGRPTFVEISKSEIEKGFKRV